MVEIRRKERRYLPVSFSEACKILLFFFRKSLHEQCLTQRKKQNLGSLEFVFNFLGHGVRLLRIACFWVEQLRRFLRNLSRDCKSSFLCSGYLFCISQYTSFSFRFEWWSEAFKNFIHSVGHTVIVLAPSHDPLPQRSGWYFGQGLYDRREVELDDGKIYHICWYRSSKSNKQDVSNNGTAKSESKAEKRDTTLCNKVNKF